MFECSAAACSGILPLLGAGALGERLVGVRVVLDATANGWADGSDAALSGLA